MGIPAKTLVKVKQEKFQDFCEICDQNKIPVLQFESDRSSKAIYVSLYSPKGQILKIAEKIKPLVIGNLAGC